MIQPLIAKNDESDILRQCASVWPLLKERRLFLTGGTGFFGKWLTQALLAANRSLDLKLHVTVLARNPARALEEQPWLKDSCFTLLKGDVNHPIATEAAFDFFLHAATAASAQLNEEAPDEMANTILEGTRHVLALTKKSNRPRFLFVSSGAVYGKQRPETSHIAESDLSGPDLTQIPSAYGEAKRMAELYCQFANARQQIQLSVARCYAFVGPYLPLDTHFAAGNFVNDVLEKRPLILKGDGTPFRSYMYPTDLVCWLLKILAQAEPGQVYNVGAEEETQLGALAHRLDGLRADFQLSLKDPSQAVQILKAATPGSPRNAYVPSTLKARTELGVQIEVNLTESFRRTLAWHLQNRHASPMEHT